MAPSNTRWVKVEVQVRCRLCGLLSPIVPMHASEVVRCERCDREQAFDPTVWPLVMDEARKARGADGPVRGEVVVADDLPRKVGVALQVNSVLDEPAQRPEGAKQYIPSSDAYRGGARVGWFMLGEEAAEDGIAVDPEAVEEAARDKRGFARNSLLLLGESALMIVTVLLWRGAGGLNSAFWTAVGVGLMINAVWGWACFSLAQRPKETDVWVYYVMALLPQTIWIGVAMWLSGDSSR